MATRPSPLLRALFNAPKWIYRAGLGWILGKRFLGVTHLGRKSGRTHKTVLEVVAFDKATSESMVISAFGTGADWYRNIQARPATRVQTGRLDYVPEQRFLAPEEARTVAEAFSAQHPWEARLAPRVLTAIGAAVHDSRDPVELLAALPMVGFRPRQ